MTAVALSVVAALCWGVSDFGGGLSARRVPVPVVLLWVEGIALGLSLAIVAIAREPLPDARSLGYAALMGVTGMLGLGAFYRALAIGTMSIVAPISATGAVLPVVVGLATGDRLATLVAIGLAITFLGVLLASREEVIDAERGGAARAAVLLALVSAVAFGGWFVFGDTAADGSVLWTLVVARAAPLPLVAAAVARRRLPLRVPEGAGPLLCMCACFELAANGLFGIANRHGELTIVSVVGSLYPVSTVLLARLVLREPISPAQTVGVLAAFAGVGLVSAG